MSDEQARTPDCKGKTKITDHRMIKVGECLHGRPEWLEASVCQDCGATSHRSKGFVCGRTRRAPKPIDKTPDTCAALRAKAEGKVP